MELFSYIKRKYGIDEFECKRLEKRVDRINSIMDKLKVGDFVYDSNCWGDIFKQKVIEIIDRDNGYIKTFEEGIDSIKIQNIDDLQTKSELPNLKYLL